MNIAIRDVVADPTIDIRNGMDAATIEEYMEVFDTLPPVIVFDTPEGMLLADGFHRYAAASRLGRTEIGAEVRQGTRQDALELAAYANASAPLKLRPEERRAGISRLNTLHPEWPAREIGRLMGCSVKTVHTVLHAERVRRVTLSSPQELPDYAAQEIGRLPEDQWRPIAKVAVEKDWTLDEVTQASRNLRDPEMDDEFKEALLEGRAEPVTHKNGEPALLPQTVQRHIAQEIADDSQVPFERVLGAIAILRRFPAHEVIDKMPRERVDSLVREFPSDIEYLNELLNLAIQRLEVY